MNDTSQPCATCGHPAIEHVAVASPLCMVCPDGDDLPWQHQYASADQS